MLLLYLLVIVVSNVSVLICDCHSHNHATHNVEQEQHKCCCGGCHTFDFGDRFNSIVDQKCGCLHDHSNKVELYVATRSSSDDIIERNLILTALLAEHISNYESGCESVAESEYNIYCLPLISSAVSGGKSLRAPPAMV